VSFVPGGRRRCQLFCQSTDGTAKKVTVFPTAARGEPVNCPFSWRLAGVDAKLFGSCPLVLPTFLPPWCGRGRGWRFSGQIAHECAWVLGSRAPLLPKSLAARSRHGRRWQFLGQIPHEDARLLGSCAPILPRFLPSRPGHGRGWRFSGHLARGCQIPWHFRSQLPMSVPLCRASRSGRLLSRHVMRYSSRFSSTCPSKHHSRHLQSIYTAAPGGSNAGELHDSRCGGFRSRYSGCTFPPRLGRSPMAR